MSGLPPDLLLEQFSRFVSSLHTLQKPDSAAWLMRAAASVSALLRPGTACWMMDAGLRDTTAGWNVHNFAIEGAGGSEAANLFRENVRQGFDAEDAVGPPAREYGVPRNLCLSRAGLYPGSTWTNSKYRALCTSAGVRDFARCVHEFDEGKQRRWFVVEAQGLDDGWTPDADMLRVLGAVTYTVARAYEHRFIRIDRLRASLTERISPAGHAVLPLLAEGLSESEIGKRIHRSTHTVHDHVKQIYRVLGVSSRLELREVWVGEREVPNA